MFITQCDSLVSNYHYFAIQDVECDIDYVSAGILFTLR